MPAVEASRSFPRARALPVLLLALVAFGCTDPVGPSDTPFESPALALSPTPIAMMASASEHACALRSTGVVECWGQQSNGEAPAYREAAGGWYTHLDVNDQHSCAVRNNGVVECWGNNDDDEAPATRSPATGQFVRVAAGGDHTCALRNDGAVECWGDDSDDQAPDTVRATGSTFQRVTAGLFHTCGLRADGAVECWGFNQGQAPPDTASPTGSPYVSMSSSTGFTCAVRADGVVECWGQEANGQAPDSVHPASSNFTQVSAGRTHACALRADGVIQCWGQNDDGEAPSTWSASVGTFTHVAAGNDYTCATGSNGFVTCVGAASAIGVPRPGRPGGMSLANVGAGLQVNWSDLAVETSFEVQRRNTRPDGTWTPFRPLRTLGRNVISHVDSTVLAGPQYQYRVRACAVGGCSEYRQSGQRYGFEPLPAPPAGATAVPVKGGVVDVAWRDSTGTEASYEVQRRLDDTTSAWAPLASVAGTVRTYRDTTGVRAARYVYRVRACNTSGCSGYSQTAAVIAETAGTRPATVTASPQPLHQVQVGWSASFNALTYGIQRRRLLSGTWGAWSTRATVAASGGPGSWSDTAVTAGVTYQYRVRGCTTLGCSQFRASAQVTAP